MHNINLKKIIYGKRCFFKKYVQILERIKLLIKRKTYKLYNRSIHMLLILLILTKTFKRNNVNYYKIGIYNASL